MKYLGRRLVWFLLGTVGLLGTVRGEHWNGFRGNGNSVSTVEGLPLEWSEAEGVAWRAKLGGYGQSSPVIWEDTVYVTSTGGEHKEQLFVEAFDLESGTLKWQKEFAASQTAAEVSEMISRGAPTPTADAEGVVAFFESGDLLALDAAGERRWERSLTKEYGELRGGHGVGSSVIETPLGMVLLVDHEGPSYLLCVDKETGENVWKKDREPRVSWSTPLYVDHEGEGQVVISSNGVVEGYRLADGERLWWVEGVEGNTVASPTSDGSGLVVMGSSDPMNSLAVRLGGSGDVTETHLAWRAESVTSSFGSPLIHGEVVYFVNRAGALQATSLSDGSLLWERRLPGSCWASPLAAGGRLYFFCKEGQTVVLDGGDEGEEAEELAVNVLDVAEGDRVYGVAVAPGWVVVRGGAGGVGGKGEWGRSWTGERGDGGTGGE
jgi:outer membrane protein assembly factor BamB